MTYNVTFDKLPLTLSEMTAMPEALLEKPEDTVALTVAALDACSRDLEEGCRMLDYLRGPRPLSNAEKQFIRERFSYGGCRKVPLSYFRGAVPANDYMPEKPFTLEIRDSSSQIAAEGFFKICEPFVSEMSFYGVHDRDLLVKNDVRIVGHSAGDYIKPLKEVDLMVIDTDVNRFICCVIQFCILHDSSFYHLTASLQSIREHFQPRTC